VTSHTPTPWRVYKNPDGTKLVGIGGKDGQGILDSGFGVWAWDDPEGIANAEMVVRAVNAHDALVNAMKEAADEIEQLRAKLLVAEKKIAQREAENENLCNVISEYGDYCASIAFEDGK
jgi:hypothetical protein